MRPTRDAADWPNAYFLPDDPFVLAAWDHAACAVDDLRMAAALMKIERQLGLRNDQVNWDDFGSATIGEVVDQLIQRAESEACPTTTAADATRRPG